MAASSLKIVIVKAYRLAFDLISSMGDALLLWIRWPVRQKDLKGEGKVIVFLGESIPPRISRMAKWLKRTGQYQLILVSHKVYFISQFSGTAWDDVHLYRNKFHLMRIVKQLKNIGLIHAFAPKSYYPDVVRKMTRKPFIIDYQDVYASYYGENPEFRWIRRELPHEKNCLLFSDGLVAHSLEPNVVFRRYIKPKPPSLFFPLCCDNDYFIDTQKILDPDDIHIVYAGGIAGSFRNKIHFGNIQFHDLIHALSEQQIHFHVYPSPANFQADFDEYRQISKENSWFHFHEPVKQEDLHVELAKYHFGIIPFFKKNTGQSLEKTRYSTALKLFNYIEAGLPVIISKDVFYQSWIVTRYKAGITIGSEDLTRIREIISGINYSELTAELRANRETISLKKNIDRLIRFYSKIATHM